MQTPSSSCSSSPPSTFRSPCCRAGSTRSRPGPITYLLEAGRGFLSGNHDVVLLAFACGVGLGALFLVWAVLGLRRAERAAG